MTSLNLYYVSSFFLAFCTLGHTFGGMLGTAKKSRDPKIAEDEVFMKMKSTLFTWRGGDCTWFNFWLGNGLGVSGTLVLTVVILWTLGGLSREQILTVLPIAWTTFLSLCFFGFLGFKYFVKPIGIAFSLIAILVGIATFQVTFG